MRRTNRWSWLLPPKCEKLAVSLINQASIKVLRLLKLTRVVWCDNDRAGIIKFTLQLCHFWSMDSARNTRLVTKIIAPFITVRMWWTLQKWRIPQAIRWQREQAADCEGLLMLTHTHYSSTATLWKVGECSQISRCIIQVLFRENVKIKRIRLFLCHFLCNTKAKKNHICTYT